MLNPANHVAPQPSSPTNSSLSSSDLDTESTGSFFHDRSTTLGTLMGVTVQAITFRATSQHRQQEIPGSGGGAARRSKNSRAAVARQRRRWWRLCRDECDSRRASLGDYLEVERRFGDGGGAAELEEGLVQEMQPRNGRALFADGMVLPPAQVVEDLDSSPSAAAGICRFSAVERWCNLV
ncbi:hypothetical protein SASPL_125861 [Salvia splendens]|uniref:Uncharacterized protein n=1 Tax=Salvia splendens TaxID=180675 RepID=A0A8X8ZQ90_SALSN|nr:uncharacterized protein At3g17950-like [Salvia splendens]KAG6413157.1 hypothetical protein SASPL_125861 [Salvia splendens]